MPILLAKNFQLSIPVDFGFNLASKNFFNSLKRHPGGNRKLP